MGYFTIVPLKFANTYSPFDSISTTIPTPFCHDSPLLVADIPSLTRSPTFILYGFFFN